MGKSSSIVTGYHYKPAFHVGIGRGPIDAYLEWRVADKTAWQGEATASGELVIDEPKLFGGEKDQGGVQGTLELMFGEAAQMPNSYLASTFGPEQPAWRGLITMVWKGGRFGGNNPYPHKHASKIRKIKQGWDGDWGGDPCWYPETAEIGNGVEVIAADTSLDATTTEAAVDGLVLDSGFAASDLIVIDKPSGLNYPAAAGWPTDVHGSITTTWGNQFYVNRGGPTINQTVHWDDVGTEVEGFSGYFATALEAEAAVADRVVHLSGSTYYRIRYIDPTYEDDRGGLSLRIRKASLLAMNPAHILVYSRTDGERGREPFASINAASLIAAADVLYDEGFGLCTHYNPADESPAEFEARICRVIDGSFERSLTDGEWYLDLARGGYDLESLPILTDADILEFHELPTTLDRAVNSLSVRYFDVQRKEQVATPAVRALGLIRTFGEIHETLDFPEIPTAELAMRVAQRELLKRITPTKAFKLVTTPVTYAWRGNQYFRLQSAKRRIDDMVCIVGERERGTLASGAIRMNCTQDIYSLPDTSYIEVETSDDTGPTPPGVITIQRADEVPYLELAARLPDADLAALPEGAGYVMAAAVQPSAGWDYTMHVATDGGPYVEAASSSWCATATAVGAYDRGPEPTVVAIEDAQRLDQVELGTPVIWDSEWCRVDLIDAGAGTVTLGRGCGDTVPSAHEDGSRLWFYGGAAAFGTTQYTESEVLQVKLLTESGTLALSEALATEMNVTMAARASLPYPPANVKVDGVDWPSSVDGEFEVTWVHRNRETQADQLVDTSIASITPAPNTRYGLRFEKVSDDSLLVEQTDIGPGSATVELDYAGDVRMRLWTIDEAGVSWQEHVHVFSYSSPGALSQITATPYTPVYDGVIIDGGGD